MSIWFVKYPVGELLANTRVFREVRDLEADVVRGGRVL